MRFAEGLLYEAVMICLGCGAVWGVQSAARYDLRVLVVDQVLNGRDVPIGHPVATFPLKSATLPPPRQEHLLQGVQEGVRTGAPASLIYRPPLRGRGLQKLLEEDDWKAAYPLGAGKLNLRPLPTLPLGFAGECFS